MITLNAVTSHLNLEHAFNFDDVLRANIRSRNQPQQVAEESYICANLDILDFVGNAQLNADKLIHYPVLCRELRKAECYPFYRAKIDINHLASDRSRGIKQLIQGLQALDVLLEAHRQQKSVFDAQVNNLIAIHGQHKVMPIYQGCKPVCTWDHGLNALRKTRQWIIKISGVKYAFYLRDQKFGAKHALYVLTEHGLLATHRIGAHMSNSDLINARFIGGVINTPILAFRCASSYKHKGSRYYLDLHTDKLYHKLSEVKALAVEYAGSNYKINIIEGSE